MSDKKFEEAFLDLLAERGSLSVSQIAEEFALTRSFCLNKLKKLEEQNIIIRVSAKNSGNIYYLLNKKATFDDVANMHIEVAKETIDAKDMYEELTLKIESVDKNVVLSQ